MPPKAHSSTVDKINAVSGAVNSLAELFMGMSKKHGDEPAAEGPAVEAPVAAPAVEAPVAAPAVEAPVAAPAVEAPVAAPVPIPRIARGTPKPFRSPSSPELHGVWAVVVTFLQTLIETLFGRKRA
jgi:hypothetical protein